MKQDRVKEIPKKIFYMVYSLTSGGIEKYSINLFKYIDKTKYQLDFITKLDREEFFDHTLYDMGGCKIPLSDGNLKSSWKQTLVLARTAYKTAKSGYKLAYFNLSSPSAVFKYPLICKFAGIDKIIIHSHNSSEAKLGLISKLVNSFGRYVINKITSERFACSDKAAAWMFGDKIVSNKQYTFVQNGIEVSEYLYNPKMRDVVRKQLGVSESDFVLGHVGRFETQKNHLFLIQMFEALCKVNDHAKLLLIGVGSLKKEIEELVREKKLDNRVLFLGEQSNINDILQAMDVFVLPSLYEGLPVVGIEAQSAGLRCIFSDSITKEADVTGNVKFVSLNSGIEPWIKAVEESKHYKRTNQLSAIVDAGYDIKSTSELVQKKFDSILSLQ